jgi:hypothetical protein
MVLTVMPCWWWLIRTMACHRYMCDEGGETSLMLSVMTCKCWLIRTMACYRYICGGERTGQHDLNSYDMLVVAYQNYGMSQIHSWGREDRPAWC